MGDILDGRDFFSLCKCLVFIPVARQRMQKLYKAQMADKVNDFRNYLLHLLHCQLSLNL